MRRFSLHGFLTGYKKRTRKYLSDSLDSPIIKYTDIRAIFIPLIIDQISVVFINILNTIMISSSGREAIAAVSMVDSLNFFLMNFYISIALGGTVVAAQYMGKREISNSGKAAAQATASAVVLSVVIGGIIIAFNDGVLSLMFGEAEKGVYDIAVVYLIWSCISYPFFAVFQVVAGVLRGIGDTKASFIQSLLLNLIYLTGNVVFLKIFNLGIYGIAISLVLARGVSAVTSMGYLLAVRQDLRIKARDFFRVDFKIQKSIMFIGLPSALEQMFFNGGKMVTQRYIVSFGTDSMAINAISGSIASLIMIPGNAVCNLIVTVVAKCFGVGEDKIAEKYIYRLTRICVAFMVTFTVFLLPVTPLITNMYNPPDGTVFRIFLIQFAVCIGMIVFWPGAFVYPSGLRAAGDAVNVTVKALLSMWLFRVMMGYVLAVFFNMNVEGVWIAMILEWGVRQFIFKSRLKGDKWRRHKVI